MLKYQLKIKSLNNQILKIYKKLLEKKLLKVKINYTVFCLPKKKKRITLLKSPHVNKSAREQFEIKQYSCLFGFKCLSLKDIKLVENLLINKPNTVSLKLKTYKN